MPSTARIIDQKFLSQYNNGTSFADNSTDFATHLKGGVLESIKARFTVEVDWFYELTKYIILYDSAASTIRLTQKGMNLVSDGFAIGDLIKISIDDDVVGKMRIECGITSIADGEVSCNNVSITLDSGTGIVDGINNITASAPDLIIGLTPKTALDFRFGLIENDEPFNTLSKLTNTDQVYLVDGIDHGTGNLSTGVAAGNNKAWITGAYSSGELKASFEGLVPDRDSIFPQTTTQQFLIVHEFTINPLYRDGEEDSLTGEDIPPLDIFNGDMSLKYVFQTEFRTVLNNPNTANIAQFDTGQGSVGYLDESFNGYHNDFYVEDLVYTVGGNVVDKLEVGKITRVTGTVMSLSSLFIDNGNPLIVGHTAIVDSSKYSNSPKEYDDIWYNDSIRTVISEPKLSSSIIKDFDIPSDNTSRILFDFYVDLTSADAIADLEENQQYLLYYVVGDGSKTVDEGSKVTGRIDVNTYNKNYDISGLFSVDKFNQLPSSYTLGTDTGFTNAKAFNESGLILDSQLTLDNNATLDNIKFDIVVFNTEDNTWASLRSLPIDLSDQTIVNGIQQINLDSTRGYILGNSDAFNSLSLTTGENTGTAQVYDLQVGYKIPWQDWSEFKDAPTDFFDKSKSFNGLNQKTSNYFVGTDNEVVIAYNDAVEVPISVTFRPDVSASQKYTIDWGDGTIETNRDSGTLYQHTYTGSPDVKVRIYDVDMAFIEELNVSNFANFSNTGSYGVQLSPKMTHLKKLFVRGSLTNVLTIPKECVSLTEINAPDCVNLKAVNIPEGLDYIDYLDFRNDVLLEEFYINPKWQLSFLDVNSTILTSAMINELLYMLMVSEDTSLNSFFGGGDFNEPDETSGGFNGVQAYNNIDSQNDTGSSKAVNISGYSIPTVDPTYNYNINPTLPVLNVPAGTGVLLDPDKYEIRVLLDAEIGQNGITTNYVQTSESFEIYDYDTDNEVPDGYSCEINTFNKDGVALASNIINKDHTELRAIFKPNVPPTFSETVDFTEVSTLWTRFAHGNKYIIDAGAATPRLDDWFNEQANDTDTFRHTSLPLIYTKNAPELYTSTPSSIFANDNMGAFYGCYSLKSYEYYSLTGTMYSNETDNDTILYVVAFDVDDEGVEHTLTLCATSGGVLLDRNPLYIKGDDTTDVFGFNPTAPDDVCTWALVYDYGKDGMKTLDQYYTTASERSWLSCGDLDFEVKRSGDEIEVDVQWDIGVDTFTNKFEYNLNNDVDTLKFKGFSQIGFGFHSQAGGGFSDVELIQPLGDYYGELRVEPTDSTSDLGVSVLKTDIEASDNSLLTQITGDDKLATLSYDGENFIVQGLVDTAKIEDGQNYRFSAELRTKNLEE